MFNVSAITNAVGNYICRHTIKLRVYAPQIMTGLGVVGAVTSTVMACRSTLKVNDILEESKKSLDIIHDVESREDPEYSHEDAQKDIITVYKKTTIDFVKLYGPAVILGVTSIGCMIGSTIILNRRNAILGAAYTALKQGFDEYRKRVVAKYGDDAEKQLYFGTHSEKVNAIIKDEYGNDKKSKTSIEVNDETVHSPYAVLFDESNLNWNKDPLLRIDFLRRNEILANRMLQSRRILTLNEVYELLGMERTIEGQQVGWVFKPKDENRDSFVDFGIHEMYNREVQEFMDGVNPGIWLDFNVDGYILTQDAGWGVRGSSSR